MTTQTAKIDRSGRISLPKPVRDFLHLRPGGHVVIEFRDKAVMLRAQDSTPSITKRIAALELPVGDWDQMEREIEDQILSTDRHFDELEAVKRYDPLDFVNTLERIAQ